MKTTFFGVCLFLLGGNAIAQGIHTVQSTAPEIGSPVTEVSTGTSGPEQRQHTAPMIGAAGNELPQIPVPGTVQVTSPSLAPSSNQEYGTEKEQPK